MKMMSKAMAVLALVLGLMVLAPQTMWTADSTDHSIQTDTFAGEETLASALPSFEVENPLYEENLTASQASEDQEVLLSAFAETLNTSETGTTYDEEQIEAQGTIMREAMVARQETFSTTYTVETAVDDYKDLAAVLFAEAVRHTGSPVEGDYLKWQYASYKLGGSIDKVAVKDDDGNIVKDDDGNTLIKTYTYNFNWTLVYYTDASMEEEVDELVDDIIEEELPQDREDRIASYTIAAAYDYVTSHVSYDHTHLSDDDYKLKYTAYAALTDGQAVCQGYALLMYRILLSCGIDCRLISGKGNGEAHGWNIVCQDGVYYDVDATWDAGKSEYTYFMLSEDDFQKHVRDSEFTTDDFNAAYPMSESSWKEICEHEDIEKVVSPTCSTKGYTTSTCIYCRRVESGDETDIDPTAHTYQAVITAPTCTEGGYTTYTCSSCGDSYRDDETEALGHQPSDEAVREIIEDATYDEDGSYEDVIYCTVCGEELSRTSGTIEALTKSYTLTFYANGGAGSMDDQVVVYKEKTAIQSCTYTRTGYTFRWWYAKRESDDKWYAVTNDGSKGWFKASTIEKNGYTYYKFKDAASIKISSGKSDETIGMYAQWKANTYKVVFKTSKGSGSMASQKFTYGTAKKLRACAFTRKGYSFAGWKCYRASDKKWYTTSGWKTAAQITKNDYEYKLVKNKASITKWTSVDGDKITCYAQWE